MFPLIEAKVNENVLVVNIRGGRRMKQRMADLGLNVGMVIRLLNAGGRGPLILAVKDSRLAIGRGMARRIFVKSEYR